MHFKTLKHKTLPDTYGHIDHYEGDSYEIAQCSMPDLKPVTADYEEFVAYWRRFGHTTVVEQLADYDLVTVWMSPPVPAGADTAKLDALADPEVIAGWVKAFAFLKDIATMPEDPLEYISRYIPREIVYKNQQYVFNLKIINPHHSFHISYKCTEAGTNHGMFTYEAITNSGQLLVALKNMRKRLEDADLLPDLYKGKGYTKELYKKEYFPGLKSDE